MLMMILLKKPLFASADKAVTVIGAFIPSAAITISPQLVVKVMVLFLKGSLISGVAIFLAGLPLALVFLHFTSAGLFGANVVAKHVPTGTVAGTITLEEGRFSLPNLRVGGPYTITFSYVGFKSIEYTDVYLDLGKTFDLNVQMSNEGEQLSEIVITGGRNSTFNNDRTGAETSVGKKELTKIPLFGFFYKHTCIIVDRSDSNSRKQVYLSAKKKLDSGLIVCIFPEAVTLTFAFPFLGVAIYFFIF